MTRPPHDPLSRSDPATAPLEVQKALSHDLLPHSQKHRDGSGPPQSSQLADADVNRRSQKSKQQNTGCGALRTIGVGFTIPTRPPATASVDDIAVCLTEASMERLSNDGT
jgi:hypothetical protein